MTVRVAGEALGLMDESSPEHLDPLGPEALRGELPGERIAHNEVTVRRLNEAIEDGRGNREGLVGFVCECGQLGCNSIVEMTLREYEELRSHPRRFVLVAGHEADFDREVDRTRRFAIVAEQGRAGMIAELADPRAEDS